MKIETLACNNCGAPLEVGETTKYATCAHCGSRLAIHRSGSALYSDVLESIDQTTKHISAQTERVSNQVSAIRLQGELDRLERQWEQQEEKLFKLNPFGNKVPPDVDEARGRVIWWAFWAAAGACGVLLGLIGHSWFIGGVAGFVLLSTIRPLLTLFEYFTSYVDSYNRAYSKYEQKRAELQDMLDNLE